MSPEPILRLSGVTKAYRKAAAVRGISFEVQAGEVLTLLGPSGCGKSTTLRMIAGLDAPDSGEIWVRGRQVAGPGLMVAPEARNIGLVFQSYAIWPHMTVAENIAYPLRLRRLDRSRIEAKVIAAIKLVRLEGLADRRPTELSGGQQQRVALARALVYEPDVLLLDEPLSNLDTVLRRAMREQLRLIQSRLSTTLLYVTHDQEEAMSLSSRVIVMNNGVIEQTGTPREIYQQPATRFVQDFVGQTIWLRGAFDVTEAAPGVRIGARHLAADASRVAGYPAGSAVDLAVRSRHVRLQRSAAVASSLPGEIVDISYFGDRLECLVRLEAASAQTALVQTEAANRLSVGDPVSLLIDPGTATLWPP